MPTPGQMIVEEEPIGIVITRGRHEDIVPRFSAYIYGLAEDTTETASEPEQPAAVLHVIAA